jgi:hypothetical protein
MYSTAPLSVPVVRELAARPWPLPRRTRHPGALAVPRPEPRHRRLKPAEADRRAIALGESQHGLLTVAQALDAGLSRRQVQARARERRWHRLHTGVYRVAGHPEPPVQRVYAACLAAGPGAAACGRSAAELWGLEGIWPAPAPEILAPHDRQLCGMRIFRTRRLHPEDVTERSGVPVTSVPRTLVDLAPRLNARVLGLALDDALRRGLTDLDAVVRCLRRLRGRGRRVGALPRLLQARLEGQAPGDSPLEVAVVETLVEAGLPRPVQQHVVEIDGRRYRIDLAYPAQRVAVEVDGFRFHRTRAAFDGDRIRSNALQAEGWRVLRFTSEMDGDELVRRLRRLLDPAP